MYTVQWKETKRREVDYVRKEKNHHCYFYLSPADEDASSLDRTIKSFTPTFVFQSVDGEVRLHAEGVLCMVGIWPWFPAGRADEIGRASCRERVLLWV